MPSRVLVHLPHQSPQLAERPPRRPARGEEFPAGWTVADYNLALGEWNGETYAYEVWVVPLLDDTPKSLDELRGGPAGDHVPRADGHGGSA